MSKNAETTAFPIFDPSLRMTNRSSPTRPARTSWLLFFMSALALGTSACASTGTVLSAQPTKAAGQHAATPLIPGVPNRPDMVTVVPFYWKPDETDDEKTKVVIQADVDGRHGVFIVDLGSPSLMLNRTFLQPSPTGGADTITDANRLPEHSEDDTVHVTMRIGTLLVNFDEPAHTGALQRLYGSRMGQLRMEF